MVDMWAYEQEKKNKLSGVQQADLEIVQSEIDFAKEVGKFPIGLLTDGFHSFDELYEFRKLYNALIFNEWAKRSDDDQMLYNELEKRTFKERRPLYSIHKSKRHNDGEPCFGGEWFIVVAVLPTGQISNHYEMKDWDLFKLLESERAIYPFDGHDGKEVMKRIKQFIYNG